MAELRVELAGIRQNTAAVASLLAPFSVDLLGVTKGCLGDPRVAQAMSDGGAVGICDTRDANLRRLRTAIPEVPLQRLYLPSLSRSFEVADTCFLSSVDGARVLAGSERQAVVIMIESGDLREGVPPELVEEVAAEISRMDGLDLEGVGTNYACFEGNPQGLGGSLEVVADAARRLRRVGHDVRRVSGGNSSVLSLLLDSVTIPPEVTELRCGESLLLGRETVRRRPLPEGRRDACIIWAEVRERYTKATPAGPETRVVLALGSQDLSDGSVLSLAPGLEEIGRSSDYLVARAELPEPDMGEWVPMLPDYRALVAAWTSPYVEVEFV